MLVIHPNDGFDLGLMSLDYDINIITDTSPSDFEAGEGNTTPGHIHLENNCRMGTIELGTKYWKALGSPEKIKLYYNEGKMLLHKG